MRPGMSFPPVMEPSLYFPLAWLRGRTGAWPTTVARLKSVRDVGRARDIGTTIARRHMATDRQDVHESFRRAPFAIRFSQGPVTLAVTPYRGETYWMKYNKPFARILVVATILVLLLSWANTINLFLIRAEA